MGTPGTLFDWATYNHAGFDYFIRKECTRCGSPFYVHALQNSDPVEAQMACMGINVVQCSWCKGKCSAAEQDHHNAYVEGLEATR